jgi:hypothetical protein
VKDLLLCKHQPWSKKVLGKVEVRNTVADRTQQSRSILDEDKVSLFVYRPHKVGELEISRRDRELAPGSPTSWDN